MLNSNRYSIDIACLIREIHTDADNLLTVYLERQSIVFVLNMLECLLSCAIELKLQDIAVEWGLDNHVYASLTGMILSLGVKTHESGDDEEYILIMIL